MKRAKGKQSINRTVPDIPARYLSIILILLFVVFGPIASAEQANKLEARDSWREIQLVLDTRDYSWCGNKQVVFSGDGIVNGKGIRLYDLDSGVVQNITNDSSHENVSCTADGRYIVFTDKTSINKQGSLFVYDRNTRTMKKVYEMEGTLLSIISRSMPLSPHANYLLGPDLPSVRQYILPGGKEVKLIPYRRGMSQDPEFRKLQWAYDESRLFLFDSNGGRLNIRDLKENYDRNFYFRIKDFWLRDMHVTKDNKFYVDALSDGEIDDEGISNLYRFDLADPDKHGHLVVSNIGEYDADAEGNVVFERQSTKDGSFRHSIYYLERGKKEAQILKEISVSSFGIGLRISSNGRGIIFFMPTAKRTREFKILIKK